MSLNRTVEIASIEHHTDEFVERMVDPFYVRLLNTMILSYMHYPVERLH